MRGSRYTRCRRRKAQGKFFSDYNSCNLMVCAALVLHLLTHFGCSQKTDEIIQTRERPCISDPAGGAKQMLTPEVEFTVMLHELPGPPKTLTFVV